MPTDIHPIGELVTDWQTALKYLKSGNKRYLMNQPIARNLTLEELKIMTSWQYPFAAILACSDSRIPLEIIFDQRPGDIFVIRNAGNIVDSCVLGSIEFAIEILKTPLIVVMSHTRCAAVINALKGAAFRGNMRTIMETIRPAVKDCQTDDDAIRANAHYVVEQIKANGYVKKTGTTVLMAHNLIETGEVLFTDRHN